MPDQKSAEGLKDRSPGILYLIVLFVSLMIMLSGLGVLNRFGLTVESQLTEIYSTALTLCLSCIGLGEINFQILGLIVIAFVITMILYFIVVKVIGGKNGRKN
jgi:maltodextrin utilization protein YvdJ